MTDIKAPKTCLAIHDLAGLGKCSLTIAMPILSAAGVVTSLLPTSLFSNHTAFPSHHKTDLTDSMLPIAKKWQEFGIKFDSIYVGYLSDVKQVEIVSEIITMLRHEDTIVVVDPVMGDNGKLYRSITPEMAAGMKKLCQQADVIIPNLTEAGAMLGIEYKEGPYDREHIEKVLREMKSLGAEYSVLTGVWFEEDEIGSAAIDREGEMSFSFAPRQEGHFHGTGDIFASVLTAALVKGKDIKTAMDVAAGFTADSIRNTVEAGTDRLLGVIFEPELPTLQEKLK